MMIRTKSPEKISKKSFQFIVGGFGGRPTRIIIDMSVGKNLRENLEFTSKGEW